MWRSVLNCLYIVENQFVMEFFLFVVQGVVQGCFFNGIKKNERNDD